jgi:hypothetical protein
VPGGKVHRSQQLDPGRQPAPLDQVAVRDDANQPAILLNHGQRPVVAADQGVDHLGERRGRSDGRHSARHEVAHHQR